LDHPGGIIMTGADPSATRSSAVGSGARTSAVSSASASRLASQPSRTERLNAT
jgi:hypothetical protein